MEEKGEIFIFVSGSERGGWNFTKELVRAEGNLALVELKDVEKVSRGTSDEGDVGGDWAD